MTKPPSFRTYSLALAILTVLLLSGCAATTFPSTSPVPCNACGPARTPDTISGEVHKPDGDGPFPALVSLHGCNGGIPGGWHRYLTSLGYVVLAVDSFSKRGISSVCRHRGRFSSGGVRMTPLERVLDAYGGLNFLATLPYVDRNRVGVIGWSHGGAVSLRSLLISNEGFYWPRDPQLKFAAGISFYPSCTSHNTGRPGYYAPVLVLVGEKDTWATPDACTSLVKRGLRAGDEPLSVHVFPDSHHGFDCANCGSYLFKGHRIEGNPEARRQARAMVAEFLERHLK